jgi:alpha-1,3-rhamnosyl/mannosyltransferase
LRSAPGIVTIHDLQPFAMPAHFSPLKRAYLRAVLPTSARAARRVVTLTTFTERDLERRLDVDAARITLVPSGVSVRDGAGEARRLPDVLEHYGLQDGRYVLYPAITYPHKNHVVLLEAFAQLPTHHRDVRLVLTGGRAQMEDLLAERVRSLPLDDVVVRTGRIPRDDLDTLYRGAAALAFPSRYEGFGLPVLEAMARDCPVVAADATALPEVVDGAGLLVPPTDAAAWAAALTRVLDDDVTRARLIEDGRERAAAFTWEAAAAELEAVYLEVLESLG